MVISIHTTLAGGDEIYVDNGHLEMSISIHTTLAGGDPVGVPAPESACISIHTTLAGGDSVLTSKEDSPILFQSTPPSRVAT